MLFPPIRRAVGILPCLARLPGDVSASSYDFPDVAEPAPWRAAVPIAGFKPLYGVQDQPVTLDARQSTCSANGSNFCFGDNVNFCATCGICCGSSTSGYCCGSDQICCGTACCAAGQTCNNGQCLLPLATVIVTSAVQVTVSHVATRVVTVEQAVVSTSTVFSTTEVTVSSGATETDIVYVTVTAKSAKRAAVPAEVEPRQDGVWDTLSLFCKRFSFPWTPAAKSGSAQIGKRALRATEAPLSPISSSTVITTSITRTSDITSFVSTTTTVPTSSIAVVTVFQTKTRVVGAQTTTTTTSTLTVTPNAAKTQTVTKTATNTPTTDPNNTSTAPGTSDTSTPSPSSGGSSSSGLSKKAIAGIAGGIGGAAVLVLVLALLWWLRRRRNRPPPHQDPSSYLEPYIPDMSSPIPGPRGSPTNRFSAAAPHHASDGSVSAAATAVGVGGGVKNLDRYSNISGGPGKKPLSPRLPDMAEAPGGEVYEADGTSRVAQGPIYEADSGQQPRPPYPVDAREMEDPSSSPVAAGRQRGHTRNVSSNSSSRYGSQGGEVDGAGFSPVSEMGDGAERIRNTNPYRTPGAYRDF